MKINIDFIKNKLLYLICNYKFLIPLCIFFSCNNSVQLEKKNTEFKDRPNILILMSDNQSCENNGGT